MRYLFLIHDDEDGLDGHSQLGGEIFAAIGRGARLISEHRLQAGHAATTLRNTSSGLVLSDGPFTADAARLSLVCVAELPDLDDALLAGRALAATAAGVEIRPLRIAR